jgi:selenocysteine lyase/cysteine desulfurase
MASDLRSEIISHLRPETQLIVSTIASNVTGREIPLSLLSEIKRKYGLKLIIDGAQAAGHKRVCLKNMGVDAFCFPAHKAMLGIMGTGVCIFGEEYVPNSLIEGGSGILSKSLYMPTDLPEAQEAGTLGLPGIVALSEGIKFLEGYGICEIERRIDQLTLLLMDRISSVKGARVVGGGGGVVSFLLRDLESEHIASMLDSFGICTRAGLHCAPLAHAALGTEDVGTVRASLSVFNTKREIDRFYKVLRKI